MALPHGICDFACTQTNASVMFQTGRDLFIPHLSWFIMHWSFSDTTLYVLSYWWWCN